MTKVGSAALLAVAAAALSAATLAGGRDVPAPQIGVVDLGTLGGVSSTATAVNDAGQVVGSSQTATGATHAFMWTQADGMVDLGTLGGDSVAVAVNEAGGVAGWSTIAAGSRRHAFFWSRATGMLDLGTLGLESAATDVNDAGVVAGNWTTAAGVTRAFAWAHTTGMVDLGTLGGSAAAANAVGNGGEIVGSSATASGEPRAFLWTQAGGMIDLGAGNYSAAAAVSDTGQVIGGGGVFSWTKAEGIVRLDASFPGLERTAVAVNNAGQLAVNWRFFKSTVACLLTRDRERTCSDGIGPANYAADLNDGGQVVGSSYVFFTGAVTHAFLWTRPLGTVDLGTLGGSTSAAADVNNLGQVVGYAELAGAGTPASHAALWDAPAPPSPPLTVAAAAGDGSATISFAPPASGGDSSIAYYTATASPGGRAAHGAGSPILVTGLDNDTAYTFTLTAVNDFDASPPSAPSNSVVPTGPAREQVDPPAEAPRPAVPAVAAPDRRPPPPSR